jgi:hypothetical protein
MVISMDSNSNTKDSNTKVQELEDSPEEGEGGVTEGN